MIFGTNLLTQSPVPVYVFPLFQCFAEKEYQTESKRNETFGRVIFGTNVIQGTWSGRQKRSEEATRQGGAPAPWVRPQPSWAPRSSTDLLLPPIYIHIPRKHPGAPQNSISTAATFCTQEITSPSPSPRRRAVRTHLLPRCCYWYVSNVSIFFYCSMLLYYLFRMFNGL